MLWLKATILHQLLFVCSQNLTSAISHFTTPFVEVCVCICVWACVCLQDVRLFLLIFFCCYFCTFVIISFRDRWRRSPALARVLSPRCMQARSDFHINVCFLLPISSRLLPCLGGLHHTIAAALCCEGWGRGGRGGRQTPHCMSTSTRNLNNRPRHRHKSQPFSSIGPGSTRLNFISPRRKIEAGGINLRYIPNTSPAIWAALQGLYFIFWTGGTNNLLEMYHIRSSRKTKLAAAESDKNKPNPNCSI